MFSYAPQDDFSGQEKTAFYSRVLNERTLREPEDIAKAASSDRQKD